MTTFFEMIETLNSDGSRLFKEAKLKEFGEKNPDFIRLLRRTYSPEYVYGIKKVPDVVNFYNTMSLSDGWPLVEATLDRLATRAVTGNAARDEVAALMCLFSKEEANVIANILKGDLRCGINVGSINRAFPGTIPEYPYMRCSLMKGSNIEKFNWRKGVFSQEKADGMFANVCVGHLPTAEVKISSRAGTLFANSEFQGFIDEIKKVCQTGVCYNGELLVQSKNEQGEWVVLPREIGNGIFNSVLKGGCFEPNQRPYYMVWDVIPIEDAVAGGKCRTPYETRFKQCETIVGDQFSPIPTRIVYSLEEAFAHYVELTSKGKEGTVIKSRDAIYADGTSKDQIKVKIEAEVDLIVKGANPGNGKNAKWFGSLICESADGKVQTNVSGFSDADRERIHGELDDWIGKKIITVCANSLMPSNEPGRPQRLFLPRFVEERLDKYEADSLEKIQQIFDEQMKGTAK